MPQLFSPGISELVVRIGWTLIHFVWQGAIIGILYAILRFNLRRSRPQVRYLLGLITLFTMACIPAITFLWLAPAHEPITARIAQDANTAELVLTGALSPASTNWLSMLLQWITFTWLAGVVLSSTRVACAWTAALRLRAESYIDQPDTWSPLCNRLCTVFHVNRQISLALSTHVITPAVIGWLKPVILMPPSMLSGLSIDQIEMILLHELAHIRRHDYLFNALQMVLETLLFYHPVVHWVSNQARAEREYCCDDMVVEFCGDRVSYLKALATLETNRAEWASVMAANGGSLLRRVQRIARPENSDRVSIWPLILSAVTLIGATYSIHAELMPSSAQEVATAIARGPVKALATTAKFPKLVAGPTINRLRIAAAPPAAIPPTTIVLPYPHPVRIETIETLTVDPLKIPDITLLPPLPAPPHSRLVANYAPIPMYPYEQLRDDTSGRVKVRFRVTQRGYVVDISTRVIDGPAAFSDAARTAISRWKFNPLRLEHQSPMPDVELTMVFTPKASGESGICVQETGSHICHRYRISVENVSASLKSGNSALFAKNDPQGHASIIRKDAKGSICNWNLRAGCVSTRYPADWQPPVTHPSSIYAPRPRYSTNPRAGISEHPHPG